MFCKNCGKEVKEQWNVCPYCKSKLKDQYEEKNINASTESSDSIRETDLKVEKEWDNEKNKEIGPELSLKEISFWKFFFLGIVTLGIYSFYIMWRFTKNMNEICKEDDRRSPNYLVVLLLCMITFGIYGLYWVYMQGKRMYEVSPKYKLDISQNGMFYLLWILFLPSLGGMISTYYLFKNHNQIVKGYNHNVYQSADYRKHKVSKLQKVLLGIIIAIRILFIVVIFLVFSIASNGNAYEVKNSSVDTEMVEKEEEDQEQQEVSSEEQQNDSTKQEQEETPEQQQKDSVESDQMSLEEYLKSCVTVTTEKLARNPQNYIGKKIVIEGAFTTIGTTLVIDMWDGEGVVIQYNGNATNINGEEIGQVLNGDEGFAAGIFEGVDDWGKMYINAEKVVVTNMDENGENTTEDVSGIYEDALSGMTLWVSQLGNKISFRCYNYDGNLYAEEYDCASAANYIYGKKWRITVGEEETLSMYSDETGEWGYFVKMRDLEENEKF